MKVCSLSAAGTLAAACLGIFAASSQAGGLQPQGAEYQLTRGVPGDQVKPRLLLDARGGWLLWQDAAIDGDGLGIAAVRIGAGALATQGSPVAVNQAVSGDQENPAVVALPDGGAFAVWQGGRQGFQRIVGRLLNPAGVPTGPDVAISSGGGEHQTDPALALLEDGSLLVVWASHRQDGSYAYDVYARRFSSAGQALAPEFRVNSTVGMNRRSPAVAALRGGGFMVGWVSERQIANRDSASGIGPRLAGNGVPAFEVTLVARAFSREGTPVGSEVQLSASGGIASHPVLAALPDGSVLAAWTRKDTADPSKKHDVVCRTVGVSGTPAGDETLINTTLFGDQYAPTLAVGRHGTLAIWTSMGQDGSWEGVFGRWIDASGTPSGDEIPINGQIGGGQIFPAVASGPDSNLVVAWSSNLPRIGYEIFAQRLAPLLLRAEGAGAGRLRLSWPTVGGGVYQLQMSRDGQTWADVGGSRAASAESDSTEVSAAGQVVLYRVLRAR